MSFPASPVLNEVFIADGKAWKFDGTNWVIPKKGLPEWDEIRFKPDYLDGAIVADIAPANPESGWMWWDRINAKLYTWTGAQWIEPNTNYPVGDPDVWNYVLQVEGMDGQPLETGVVAAIGNFIYGCKADGIWDAIKSACLLAGARTLAGALIPLKGAAPTNVNFMESDYDRQTGLKGDGSTKYLNSNRASNDDPVDSKHLFVNFSEKWTRLTNSTGGNTNFTALGQYNLSGASNIIGNTYGAITLIANGATKNFPIYTTSYPLGGVGASVSGTTLDWLFNNDGSAANPTTTSGSVGGATPTILAGNIAVFGALQGSNLVYQSNPRLSFYSIGESIDLVNLNSRVSSLMTEIQTAIP
jgi:hypothetical protein